MSGEGARLFKTTAWAGRVLDLLEQPAERDEVGMLPDSLDGDIVVDAVSHRYADGRGSIDMLSTRLPGGALVAVTGENGTGKSTLLSLLLRLERPSEGTITIDGIPIDRYRLSAYRSHLAYVPQQLDDRQEIRRVSVLVPVVTHVAGCEPTKSVSCLVELTLVESAAIAVPPLEAYMVDQPLGGCSCSVALFPSPLLYLSNHSPGGEKPGGVYDAVVLAATKLFHNRKPRPTASDHCQALLPDRSTLRAPSHPLISCSYAMYSANG